MDTNAARTRAAAIARSIVFTLEMLPTHVRIADAVTKPPAVEPRWLVTPSGRSEADLYRPASRGPHPGIVVALGVIPAGMEHPLVTQLGQALARSGFVALLLRSTTMRDLRLDAGDIAELASAYETLVAEPYVDLRRSGLLGVCVGGAFALMAAASASIRSRVAFVFAYASYSSIATLAIDIASRTRSLGVGSEPWNVDPLTWTTYVRSLTQWLPARDRLVLRDSFEGHLAWNATRTAIVRSPIGDVDPARLSDDGRAVLRLLRAGADDVRSALADLPAEAKELLNALSPLGYIHDIAAPRVMLLHDRYDHVIPVGESRRLWAAFAGRPGVTYREMGLQHLRMPRGLSPLRLLREIGKTYLAWYPLFGVTTA